MKSQYRSGFNFHSSLNSYVRNGYPLIAVLLFSGLALLLGDSISPYSRKAIQSGDLWCAVSGQFKHLGAVHWLLNGAVLVVLPVLLPFISAWEWIVSALLSLLAVAFGLWFFSLDVSWYVGLSGVLHGLILYGALRGILLRMSRFAVLILVVAGKVIYEQCAGPSDDLQQLIDGRVIVDAHLYGAFSAPLMLPCYYAVKKYVS